MRCEACERSWNPSARFCGRCGQRLGPHRADGRGAPSGLDDRPGRSDGPGTAGRGSPRGIVTEIVVALAVGALAVGALALTAMPTFLDGTGRPRPVAGDVSVPTADPITDVVRATDRRPRPADCSDDLQDLPRPVRHYGLYTGRLEWRDGRLCAPVTDPDPDPAPPRCDPPWALVCAIP